MTFWNSIFRRPRIIKYRLLSNNRHVTGQAHFNQPVLLTGKGPIRFGQNVQLGFFPSPFFYSGYIHLESRTTDSFIDIGDNVMINNNFYAISAGAGISIGADTLIGLHCEIIDSDFHELTPEKRRQGNPAAEKVVLGRNVFVGNNVKIMKGVVLGNNVVVGNGSLVNTSFEDNVIIGGIPAKVIGRI